jgi:sirohydrochlorin cobaltochelatase
MALARMMDEGFTHVAVQSLHTIAGEEFHDLQRNALAFGRMAGGFQQIQVGLPLLASDGDLQRVVAAMIEQIPPQRKPDAAVVLMGHGTPHPANAVYAALAYHFQRRDPNIFVGAVEGAPSIEEIRDTLIDRRNTTANLIPFMSVAGDHALNDLAGDEADSWKSVLTAAGIACLPVMKGTAEYDGIVRIWVDHLGAALARME